MQNINRSVDALAADAAYLEFRARWSVSAPTTISAATAASHLRIDGTTDRFFGAWAAAEQPAAAMAGAARGTEYLTVRADLPTASAVGSAAHRASNVMAAVAGRPATGAGTRPRGTPLD